MITCLPKSKVELCICLYAAGYQPQVREAVFPGRILCVAITYPVGSSVILDSVIYMRRWIKDVHCCDKTTPWSRIESSIVSLPYTQQQKPVAMRLLCQRIVQPIGNMQTIQERNGVAGWEKMKIGYCVAAKISGHCYTQSYCASCDCKQALQSDW
jgi:hypothetical protein